METNGHNNNNGDGLSFEYVPIGRGTMATITARLAGDVLAVERFDLGKPKQRADFTQRLCEGRPEIGAADVEAALLKLAAELAARHDQPEPAPEAEPDHLGKMPEAVKREAAALLESPKLLDTILDHFGELGIAGERELALCVYLCGTSRLLNRPLALIIQGPSSSGKSYVAETVARMFPPEAVLRATAMTPSALFYLEPGSLKHVFVCAGERSRLENDDRAEATRALREMLSAGELFKLCPMKLGGEIVTQKIHQEGPIAYCESTTVANVFDEDANRCIMLNTDEQPTQTRRILRRLASGYSGAAAEAETKAIVEKHWAMQRMLRGAAVVVPYAERLAELLDDSRVEIRRAFPHLVSTIQASALLHQKQRQIDAEGRLIATHDDYELTRHLLLKPLGRLLGGRLSDPAQRFLERLRTWFTPDDTFTRRDCARRETGSRSSVYGWLGELHDAGLLEQVEAGRGRAPSKWQLAAEGAEAESSALLPSVEKLFPDSGRNHGHKPEDEAA